MSEEANKGWLAKVSRPSSVESERALLKWEQKLSGESQQWKKPTAPRSQQHVALFSPPGGNSPEHQSRAGCSLGWVRGIQKGAERDDVIDRRACPRAQLSSATPAPSLGLFSESSPWRQQLERSWQALCHLSWHSCIAGPAEGQTASWHQRPPLAFPALGIHSFL